MSLQWLSAAAFLYTEIGLGLLFCLGFISNSRWQSVFTSKLLALVKQYGNFLFSAFVLLMFVLFIDSAYQTQKYSRIDVSHVDLRNNPQAEVQAHMKLFRAQRNLYITGFSLFMLIVLRRLVTLISSLATLEASHAALGKQAKGASEQARKLMDENEKLRKGTRESAATDTDAEDEKEELKKKVKELTNKLSESKTKLNKSENDLTAMKSQSEGLHKEYDRLLDEHSKLEKKLSIAGGDDDVKKDN